MKRSGDVTASAIVLLLYGLAILVAAGALPRILLRINPGDHARVWRAAALPILRETVVAAGAIVTAYGIFRLRPWARISILSMSAGMVGFGAYWWVDAYLTLPNHGREAYGAVTDSPLFLILCLALALIVPGSWWIVLFTCSRVRNQFARRDDFSRTAPGEDAAQ